MKATKNASNISHVIILTVLFLLFTSCATTMSQQEIQNWVNSQPLLEEFPFPPDVYQLDKPTVEENNGIKIIPFQFNEGTCHGVSVTKSLMGGSTKVQQTIDTDFKLKITPKNSSLKLSNVTLLTKQNTKMITDIFMNKNVDYQIETNSSFDILKNDSEIKCENISTTINSKFSYTPQSINSFSTSPIGLIDLDTDKTLTLGEPFMIIAPVNNVKIGDQWEKQAYSEFSISSNLSDMTRNSVEYTIYLYTYTLTGFGNIYGKRCAIINYQLDKYLFQSKGKTKDDLRKAAKTLSKLTEKEIKEYMDSSEKLKRMKIAEELRNISVATQKSFNQFGIIAYDYRQGIVIDSHSGLYMMAGMGVAKMAITGVSKAQTIFHLSE